MGWLSNGGRERNGNNIFHKGSLQYEAMPELLFLIRSLRISVKEHADMQHCIIQCCNNTHQGAPRTGKQTIRTRVHRSAVLACTVPYGIHVEWKIVTDNHDQKWKEFSKMWCACNISRKLALRTSVMVVTLLVCLVEVCGLLTASGFCYIRVDSGYLRGTDNCAARTQRSRQNNADQYSYRSYVGN